MTENSISEFKFLLDKIRRNTNIDFSQYRADLLQRRIQQRLRLTGCDTYMDYVMFLNENPGEYDRLVEALTIKVSEFFRDADAFDLLSSIVVPQIVASKQEEGTNRIRAWSCGAALGQEAYSMAIVFCETLGRELNMLDLSILATDIDRVALEKARWGSYDRKALGKVSQHILFKYFSRLGDGYVVSDKARALVTFRYHDIVSGKAMSGMDLVVCKNLLIYFEKELRAEVLTRLHSAMNPGGFLILGGTECAGLQLDGLFEVVNAKKRVYRKARASGVLA